MKFYLDENLSPRVAQMLRERGIDAISAYEAGNAGLDDQSQLRYASAHDRVVVTADAPDFIELDAAALASNTFHAGVALVPPALRRRGFAALAVAIEDLARRYPAGIPQTLVYLAVVR